MEATLSHESMAIGSYSISIVGTTVSYAALRPHEHTSMYMDRFDVDERALTQFIDTLIAIGVPTWNARYEAPQTDDGLRWNISIDCPRLRITSCGHHATPNGYGDYIHAVRQLLNGRDF